MDERQALAQIRTALANLYSDVESIRRIAYDSGLSEAQIVVSNHALNSWYNVLQEAKKRRKLDKIILLALKDYDESQELQEAWEIYQEVKLSKKTTGKATKKPTIQLLRNWKIFKSLRIPRNLLRYIRLGFITFVCLTILVLYGKGLEARQCVVDANIINLREGPGNNYAFIGRLYNGTRIQPLAIAYDIYNQQWLKLTDSNGNTAWLVVRESSSIKNTITCPQNLRLPVEQIKP
jgi:hypothetical protein